MIELEAMGANEVAALPAKAGREPLIFDRAVWEPALQKYGAVVRLTVKLYDRHGAVALGPVHPTPLFDLLGDRAPDLFAECARRCLQSPDDPSSATVTCVHDNGVGVAGVSLRLDGEVVAAVVAGYALIDFVQVGGIERLARASGVDFARLWDVARREIPLPLRRFEINGELLQVLGDAILKENLRTRRSEGANVRLKAESVVKDEAMATLSHELRSPLTPILAWAEVLRAGIDPTQARRAGDVIKRNVELQARLVDDLLDLNRATRGGLALDLERHQLGDVLASALETVSEAASRAGVRLEIAGPDEPLAVEGDAGRLQQVFVNILSNACKFTPPGGRIDVTMARAGESAVVAIADTGEGIAPEFLPSVFELFRQQEQGAQRRHSGLGVGLALVKQLIEMHGGDVRVASEGENRGTTVTVRLPLAPEMAAETTASGPVVEEARSRSPLAGVSILLVEDLDDSREVTRLMLERLGARVAEARNGEEALEVVAASRPDLVLCDLSMPRMDGFSFLGELHRRFGTGLPVVAVSGRVSTADRARTRAAGFEGHIGKPLDWDELLRIVDRTRRRPA